MPTAPACSSVYGWTGTFMVINNTDGTLYAAPQSLGTSFFKHTSAPDPSVNSSEALYLNGLNENASSACMVFVTAGGQDGWFFQYSTEADGSGIIKGSGTHSIPAGDSAIVMTLVPASNGSTGNITSYPSGTSWSIQGTAQ